MSIGPTSWSGVVGSLASTPAKNSSTDRATAAADGVLQENEAAGDRDGDGRDPGAGGSDDSQERGAESLESSAMEKESSPHGSLDATGNLGHHLDLDV